MTGCDRELELVGGLSRGEVGAELREHAKGCPDCSEAARIAVWMNRMANDPVLPTSMPDASIVRLKAQLLGKTPADQRILQPLRLLHRIGFGVVGLCWALALTWKWEAIANFSLDRAVTAAIGGAAVSPSMLALFFTLACATVLLTVHSALIEE